MGTQVLGFRALGFRVWGLGFGVYIDEEAPRFRIWGLGFGVYIDEEAPRCDAVAFEEFNRLWRINMLRQVQDRRETQLLQKQKVLATREPTPVDAAADSSEIERGD